MLRLLLSLQKNKIGHTILFDAINDCRSVSPFYRILLVQPLLSLNIHNSNASFLFAHSYFLTKD
jgi:hypothetical protein